MLDGEAVDAFKKEYDAFDGDNETVSFIPEEIKKLEGEYSELPFVVYGPFEAQIYKLNEKYRMRMMIKCKLNQRTRGMFSQILTEFAENRKVILSIDLNPLTV